MMKRNFGAMDCPFFKTSNDVLKSCIGFSLPKILNVLVWSILILGLKLSSLPLAQAAGKARPALPPIPPASSAPAVPVLAHGEFILRVMNYNVFGLPGPCNDCSRLGDIGRELKRMRQQGNGPHIIAIQEGFNVAIEDLIREAGFPYRVWGPGTSTARISSGLVILSEFPLRNSKQHAFDPANLVGFDWNSRKGLVYTQVQVPGVPEVVEFLNTHMQADGFGATLNESVSARMREHLEVGRFLRSNLSTQGPVIFAGDFNTFEALPDYPMIAQQTGLMNILNFCKIMGTCDVRGQIDHELQTCVDHQFFRPHTTVNLEPIFFQKLFQPPVNGRRLSDHDAQLVHYRIKW